MLVYWRKEATSGPAAAIGVTAWLSLWLSTPILHDSTLVHRTNKRRGGNYHPCIFQVLDDGTNFCHPTGFASWFYSLFSLTGAALFACIWPFQLQIGLSVWGLSVPIVHSGVDKSLGIYWAHCEPDFGPLWLWAQCLMGSLEININSEAVSCELEKVWSLPFL